MSGSVLTGVPADRHDQGGSCAAGQLIAMTEWTLPHPQAEAASEVPCPRP